MSILAKLIYAENVSLEVLKDFIPDQKLYKPVAPGHWSELRDDFYGDFPPFNCYKI